ncbi:hypothetical protein Tco_0919252 [Tanacetum coccineum]
MAESENRSPQHPPEAHTGYVFMWPEAISLVLGFGGNCIHHPAKKIQQSRALDTFIEDVISPDSSKVVAAFTERREEKISVHIEQRPAFESMDLALTVVKAIAGQTRIKSVIDMKMEELLKKTSPNMPDKKSVGKSSIEEKIYGAVRVQLRCNVPKDYDSWL